MSQRPIEVTPPVTEHMFFVKMATPGSARKRKNSGNLGKGIRVECQSKQIILNVYNYYKQLQSKSKRGLGAFDRTLQATGKNLKHTHIHAYNIILCMNIDITKYYV